MLKEGDKSNARKLITGIAIVLLCIICIFVGYKVIRGHMMQDKTTEKTVDTRLKKLLDEKPVTKDVTVAVIDSGINMEDDWNDRILQEDE